MSRDDVEVNGMTRIWLDPEFTHKRWIIQRRFTWANVGFSVAVATCVIGYISSLDTITPVTIVWPLIAVAMSICTILASYSHTNTLKGFADMATDRNTDV